MIVGIEQHKRLRKLGFPMVESCKDATTGQDVIYKFPMPYNDFEMRLPKLRGDINVHEALDWIRGEKGVVCYVDVMWRKKKYKYYGRFLKEYKDYISWFDDKLADSHPLAGSALLDELLTYLEENNHANK